MNNTKKPIEFFRVSSAASDHCESVAEKLRMNGFDVKVIFYKLDPIIEYDSIAGKIKYKCIEETVMGDYYRFISHVGSIFHKWGLEKKD